MAYLLHPSSFTAPAAHDGGSGADTAGARLIGSARSLLHVMHSAIFGGLTHFYAQSSAPRSVVNQTCASGGGRTGLSTQLGYRKASSSASTAPLTMGSRAQQQQQQRVSSSVYGVASAGSPAATTAAAAVSGAELYRRAVDFADVEEVLRCPLPPVEGCPTPCAYGGKYSTSSRSAPAVSPSASGGARAAAASTSQPPPLTFRCIAADACTGIAIFSAPVKECPMHLMRAYAILPCAPREVLQYMDNDVRPKWDSYIRRSALLRELPSPEVAEKAAQNFSLSSSLGTAKLGRHSPTSFSARTQQSASPSPSSLPSSAVEEARAFAYKRGQRRVAIHYLETRSPVPFVQDRDFELVVAEEVRADGTAYSKALSTPFGYHMPLDPQQSRYVRAVVLLSGLIARPLDLATAAEVLPPVLREHHQRSTTAIATDTTSAPTEYCVLEYVGLVHPMGMLPAVLVNVVISAQLNAMRKMQTFIMRNPMSALRAREALAAGGATRPPLQPTVTQIKKLSVALQAAPSAAVADMGDAAPATAETSATSSPEADVAPEMRRGGELTGDCPPETRGRGRLSESPPHKDVKSAACAVAKAPAPPQNQSRRWWQRRPGWLRSRL